MNGYSRVGSLFALMLIFSHGSPAGGEGKVAVIRRYLEALREAVIDDILAGEELEKMQQSIRLDEFRHLARYEEWLPLNIEGVWKPLMYQSGMAWRPSP